MDFHDSNKFKSKFAYRLADALFDREFLTNYSWTGLTRHGCRKLQFSGFNEIITSFCEIMTRRDATYTEETSIKFLRESIIKSSVQRFKDIIKHRHYTR